MTSDADPIAVNLTPIGLVCGGTGTPLSETWIDLTVPNQVLYGLNGAGKTTVLDSLRGALDGHAAGGRILALMPYGNDSHSVLLADHVSQMLIGQANYGVDHAYEIFRDDLVEGRQNELASRFTWAGGDFELGLAEWSRVLEAAARSQHWIFEPIGTDSARWTAMPVVLVDEGSVWSRHLEELIEIDQDENTATIPRDLGFEPLWWNTPDGAVNGIVCTLLERRTQSERWDPYWPFGAAITDAETDDSAATRESLARYPVTRWGSYLDTEDPNPDGRSLDERVAHLSTRADRVLSDANRILSDLLADAPVLQLTVGDHAAWFSGRSCTWTATRSIGDPPIALSRLSSAERRWAHIAISLALAEDVRTSYSDDFAPTTWLLLDEPERGLHRTAETQMAHGLRDLAYAGLRTIAATHSPELLDEGLGAVNYVRRRTRERPGVIVPMGQFDSVRDDLGLHPSDMLRRIRGIALVEGEHDLEVLRGAVGPDLDGLGILLLATRGAAKLKTVVDSRFLFEATDAVLFPVLDDLDGSVAGLWADLVLEARTQPASTVITRLHGGLNRLIGKGQDFLREFLGASIKNGTFDRIQPLGIPETDILLCLPVQEFVPTAESWEQLRLEARKNRGGVEPTETQFKEFLRKTHRANLSAENVRRIASASPPSPSIEALVAAMAARLGR